MTPTYNRVLVVGAGGIGRSIAVVLNDLLKRKIPYLVTKTYTFVDPDEVDEQNVWTQGYDMTAFEAVLDKATALKREFPRLRTQAARIEKPEQLDGYDAVLIAVDNLETRRMVYAACDAAGRYFVDMRVNGRMLMVQDSDTSAELKAESLEGTGEAPQSCLFKWEKEQGIIHTTPIVAAAIGLQFFLNKTRGEPNHVVEMAL